MIFIDTIILSVVGVGYFQLVMFFDYQETICCTVLGIKTQGKRIKTCLFRKIFSCFCACLVKKWEIPPISEVSKNSFPPRLSPRRSVSSFFHAGFPPEASRMAYINTSHPDFLQAGTVPGKFWESRLLSQVFQKMGSLEGCSWWILAVKISR